MLSSLLKEHQIKVQTNKELQEKKKQKAIVATSTFAIALVDHLNIGVDKAYVNQRKLDTEIKILQSNIVQFSKQTNLWLKLVEEFNKSIKEIGDVENWARNIEADMRTISSALEYAYKGQEST